MEYKGSIELRSNNVKYLVGYWVPVLLYLGVIFLISSIPNVDLGVKFVDKFAHIVEYGILGYLLMRAISSTKRLSLKTSFLFIILFILVYGVCDEMYQSFIPGRNPSLSDLIFDLIGGAFGGILFYRSSRNWRRDVY